MTLPTFRLFLFDNEYFFPSLTENVDTYEGKTAVIYGLPVLYADASYGPSPLGCHSFGFFEDVLPSRTMTW